MSTKENMTSQRGFLKSIQSRVNTLASILYFYKERMYALGLHNVSAYFGYVSGYAHFPCFRIQITFVMEHSLS